MKDVLRIFPRSGLFAVPFLGVALLGVLGAGFLSAREFCAAGTCPSIGVPACYLVFIAYVSIFASVFPARRTIRRVLFFAGFAVVFGLAFPGSIMQAMGAVSCPRTSSGIPMCYISLGMSLVILGLFILNEKAHVE